MTTTATASSPSRARRADSQGPPRETPSWGSLWRAGPPLRLVASPRRSRGPVTYPPSSSNDGEGSIDVHHSGAPSRRQRSRSTDTASQVGAALERYASSSASMTTAPATCGTGARAAPRAPDDDGPAGSSAVPLFIARRDGASALFQSASESSGPAFVRDEDEQRARRLTRDVVGPENERQRVGGGGKLNHAGLDRPRGLAHAVAQRPRRGRHGKFVHQSRRRRTEKEARPRSVPALARPLQQIEHRRRRAEAEPFFDDLQLGRIGSLVSHPTPHRAVIEVHANPVAEVGARARRRQARSRTVDRRRRSR